LVCKKSKKVGDIQIIFQTVESVFCVNSHLKNELSSFYSCGYAFPLGLGCRENARTFFEYRTIEQGTLR